MTTRRLLRKAATIPMAIAIFVCSARFAGRWSVQAQARSNDAPETHTSQVPTAPTLKVYSRETIVDVTVTDSKGNPVHGLTRDDFTIKEDNKPQSIRSFEEFDTTSVPPSSKLPPNTYTDIQPPPASDAVNIFLLDFTNAAPVLALSTGTPGMRDLEVAISLQHHIKQEAMKYLQSMPTGTRAAVLGAAYPSRLHILQGVTSDPNLLSAAIDTMPYDTDAKATKYESWCYQQEMRNRMTIETLEQISVDLVAIKGRKNLIWFVSNMDTLTSDFRSGCLTDYTRDLQKVYGVLAAAQVTVFLISQKPSLWYEAFAEGAGGVALYGTSDLASLIDKAIRSGSDYYTLSYVPPGSEYDGRHHTIKLTVVQPGLQLTYRNSYYAEDPTKLSPAPGLIPGLTLTTTPPAVKADNMKAAMSRSMPTSQEIHFDVQVEPSTIPAKPDDPPILGTLDPVIKAKLKGKPLTRYGFQYAVPARQLTFNPGPNGTHKGTLELDLAAYDADGKLVTGLSQTVSMPLSDDRYQEFIKSPFHFTQQLDLPPGQFFLRIGVLDPTSNKVGTLEIPLTVGKGSIAPKPDALKGTPGGTDDH